MMRRNNILRAVLAPLVACACHSAPVEVYREPEVRIQPTTVERLTADSLFLSITVSEQDGQLKRVTSLTNRALRPHTVTWLPYCGDLYWVLWEGANTAGSPKYDASRASPCALGENRHILETGETFAPPEWQVVTRASKIVGDSLAGGSYFLGVYSNISDVVGLLRVGPVELLRP